MKKITIFILFLISTQSTYSQWTGRDSRTNNTLRDVFYTDFFHITIVGDYGTILHSSNAGTDWYFQSSGVTENLQGVIFINPDFGIVVGESGIIIKTIDGGSSWVQIASGTTQNLNSISCLDSNTFIVVGTGGVILKSIDAGNNWFQLNSGTTNSLYDVSFPDTQHGFIAGFLVFLKTTNAGTDWISQPISSNYFPQSVDCIDSNNCTAVGLGGLIIKTIDAGNNWIMQTSGTTSNLRSIAITDTVNATIVGSQGPAPGSYGTILKTLNGGINWMTQVSWANNLNSVSCLNANTGIAVGTNGMIRMTFNGGVPVELTNFTATAKNGIVELNWSTATETNNHIFEIERKNESFDFITIGYVDGAGTTTEPQEYIFIDRNVEQGLYIYRLKQIDFDGSFEYSDEVEVNATGRLTFSLYQNYPNPFNPSTKIKYTIPSVGTRDRVSVQLKVYDVLGNEIATLINEEKQPGTYEVEFNGHLDEGRNLTGGIYFYQLKVGNYIETKKMVLMK